ncbi:MAG: Anti sigma-E protein RseA, N-terminal domain [Burkholderiaceae bacterium]|nr:Anti sigma-E protein RseA, N-terminal domain [Burkholderiaceae bacterium]
MREKISALVDGELSGSDLSAALSLLQSPGEFAALDAYHRIRHVLRAGSSEPVMQDDFAARLRERLRNG